MKNTTFRYFRDPHHFSSYTEEPRSCPICGLTLPGYAGPFYGEHDLDFICEPCLASGRLAELHMITNNVDRQSLSRQIQAANPGLSDNDLSSLVQQIASEVEERTPAIITWQDLEWPAHCADCCCYIKEVGKPELNALAPGGDRLTFFSDHLYDTMDIDVEDVWESIRPNSPTSNDTSYSTAIYLFQCLHCRDYTILWDTD